MAETYKPQKGDRVKITVEGIVTRVASDSQVDLQDGWSFDIPSKDRAIVTIEKLADPEPEWMTGDVIKAGGMVLGYTRGLWRNLTSDTIEHRNLISNYWKASGVEILHKADVA